MLLSWTAVGNRAYCKLWLGKFFIWYHFFPLLLIAELIVVLFIFQIQDLEATIHKKDMELNDLNAR